MQIGLHALGIGSGARRDVLDTVARCAETAGFSTLWAGEHVLMVDDPTSRYPYTIDGRIPIPPQADWLDPFIGLSFAAASTTDIGLATGVLLLPERNPLIVAKEAASLDSLSGGRLVLGVGIGWSAEEFSALGVPFDSRARRTEEYVAAIRRVWQEDVATFRGSFINYESVRVNPRPVRDRRVPIFFGGNSVGVLRRAVTLGDGWYGFNLRLAEVSEKVDTLRHLCREQKRDPDGVQLAVALADGRPQDRAQLVELGIHELVVVASPPDEAGAVSSWVDQLARGWLA